MQWAAPFKVGLGFLFVQCPPAFEAVFRSSSCLKSSRTWIKKELSCAVFSGSQLLCAGEVPTLGKMILLHWCTTLYSTTWMHFTVLLETDSSSTLELNFCRRIYPESSTLTTFTPPESFSLAFTSTPPCPILLHPSRLNFYAHSSLSLSFLSQGSALENCIWNSAVFTLRPNASVGQDDL